MKQLLPEAEQPLKTYENLPSQREVTSQPIDTANLVGGVAFGARGGGGASPAA